MEVFSTIEPPRYGCVPTSQVPPGTGSRRRITQDGCGVGEIMLDRKAPHGPILLTVRFSRMIGLLVKLSITGRQLVLGMDIAPGIWTFIGAAARHPEYRTSGIKGGFRILQKPCLIEAG
jgi:hypothetical protein